MPTPLRRNEILNWRSEFFVTACIAIVTISIIAFMADHWSQDADRISFGFFTASGHSVKVFIFTVLGSILASTFVFQVLRATGKQTGNYVNELWTQNSNYLGELSKVHKFLDDLREAISGLTKGIVEGNVRLGTILYRVLRYDQERGTLLNRLEDSPGESFRNVLFDSRTISSIFRQIKERESATGKALADRESVLFLLGKRSGTSFGSKIFGHLQHGQSKEVLDREDLHQWLTYWCKFDTDAGFGRFEIAPSRDDWRLSPKITLRHSFLTETAPGEPQLRICEFMTGYIEGILAEIPESLFTNYGLDKSRLRIEHAHNSKDCAFFSKNYYAGCTFELTLDDEQRRGRRHSQH